MASDLAASAKDAFIDENFDLAVDLYSQAIDLDPSNANLFADRAQANIKLSNFTDAVADANKATELDPSLSKGYLRKGAACIKLEEYHTAKAALEAGLSLAPGDSRFTKLLKECNDLSADETKELQKTSVTDVSGSGLTSSDMTAETSKDNGTHEVAPDPVPAVQSKPKYRHDFYNSSAEVVVNIFAKGIPSEHVSVDFGEQILSVSINVPGEKSYHFQPRLFGKIVPEKSKYTVLPSKIEIRLAKVEMTTWTSLDYNGERRNFQKPTSSSAVTSQRPSYPSSKSRTDWDKLEAQVKKEEKDAKIEGDAALNKLFQDIYKDGDEDMRRAMMKSFVESNGTVLSTNWKDVGKKKVEGSPPDGMELKKWEY